MPAAHTCVGFHVDCATMAKGIGVTLIAFTLFVGSVYLMLSFVFGRWMGFLVLVVCFSGWMIIQSSLWFFGFWSQGPETPTNQGPRGREPAWVVDQAGLDSSNPAYGGVFKDYPNGSWKSPAPGLEGSVQSVSSAATTYLAAQANAALGRDPIGTDAITGTQFVVDDIKFAASADGKTSLAVVQAHYSGGGPVVTLTLYHDTGSVPRYSLMFIIASVVLFLIFLPMLDRAEKKRKEFLTGGGAPAWYGPA